jgi:TM2 domain-containing membrane protein YozV
MPSKHPLTALLLSLIPGLGHLYLGRSVRAFFYGSGFFGPMLLLLLMIVTRGYRGNWEIVAFLLIIAALVGVINVLDMVISLVRGSRLSAAGSAAQGTSDSPDSSRFSWRSLPQDEDNERIFTILLSFIPGLGHLQLGMMQRGLAFLIAFFGVFTMIVFVASLTSSDRYIVFLGVLPIIWLYGMFDCIQQLNRKKRGEALLDQTFLDDFQESREDGRKSKVLATFMSIVPGAGHMYLGLQKRGLQLMAAFFLCIYILDVLRLSLFLFLIPILWFYSFFDALQQISKQGREPLRDIPIVDWLVNHQRWVGIVLLGFGLYYLTDEMLLRLLDVWFPQGRISILFHRYFQTIVVSIFLIGGGLWLLAGSYRKKR